MENKTLRVGLMNLLFGTAWPIGAALSGVLFQKLGFSGVYYLSTILYVISFLYGLICIKENTMVAATKISTEKPKSCIFLWSDFFNIKHVKEAFRVTFKKGIGQKRIQLLMLLVLVVVVQGPNEGSCRMLYLYFLSTPSVIQTNKNGFHQHCSMSLE